jgi:hypothetical protein
MFENLKYFCARGPALSPGNIPVESFEDRWKILFPLLAGGRQPGQRLAPGLSDGLISTGQGDVLKMGKSLVPGIIRQQKFSPQIAPSSPYPVPSKETPITGRSPDRPCSAIQAQMCA